MEPDWQERRFAILWKRRLYFGGRTRMGLIGKKKAAVGTPAIEGHSFLPLSVLQSAPISESGFLWKVFLMRRQHCGSRSRVGFFESTDLGQVGRTPVLRSYCQTR